MTIVQLGWRSGKSDKDHVRIIRTDVVMRHIVVDSGASKAEWVYFDGERHHSILTSGIHPYFLDSTDAFHSFADQFSTLHDGLITPPFESIYYFGTGCSDESSKIKITSKLRQVFDVIHSGSKSSDDLAESYRLHISTDLDGAAKATFPDSEGVMILLGTGSIFAKVNCGEVVQRIPSLGYVLGDEGSAAFLGKRIYTGYFRELWSPETLSLIKERTGFLSYGEQMSALYTHPQPSAYLGNIARLALCHPLTDELSHFLKQEFVEAFTLAMELINGNELSEVLMHNPGQVRTMNRAKRIDNPLSIALSGGVIQAHHDTALECANMVFHGHKVTIYPSFATSVSRYLAEGKLTIKHVD